MLVLSRKVGESINIGGDIIVKVVSAGKDRVRIGIEAPNDIRILRTELTVELPTTADVPVLVQISDQATARDTRRGAGNKGQGPVPPLRGTRMRRVA